MCFFYSKLFQNEQGEPLKEGDIVRFEKLADTLEIIAEFGADAFYTGQIAEQLVSDIQTAGDSKCHSLQILISINICESVIYCVFQVEQFLWRT